MKYRLPLFAALSALVVHTAMAWSVPTELVVSPDGTGTHRTLSEALAAAPTGTPENPTVIRVRPGTYREVVYIQREKRYIRLIGEDPATTKVVFGLYAALPGPDGKPLGTFRTPTATFDSDDMTVENLSFINDAGPKGQALAATVNGDRLVFRNCRFEGWQDTLFDNRGRHFYQGCTITGTTDFIFGGGIGFFEDCQIISLGNGYITAASTPQTQPYGFVFSKCVVSGGNDTVRTSLGRPWRDYAMTTWLECEMTSAITPSGWSEWGGRENTARYSEYRCFGPGADRTKRVAWARVLPGDEAEPMCYPERVLAGSDAWNPRSGLLGGAKVKTDIIYREVAGKKLTLDASVPEAGAGPFPMVILIHGGGWGSGEKQGDIAPLLGPKLSGHFTWFTINYRLAPKHQWPACRDDVEVAIRWIREHAAEYKGDPNRIILVGYSAGGQLAMRVALDPKLHVAGVVGLAAPTDLLGGVERRGLSAALKNLFGTTEDKPGRAIQKRLREMSALYAIGAQMPPCLLVHGSEDKSVPTEQSAAFVAKAGTKAKLVTVTGAPHAIVQWSHYAPDWRAQVVDWIASL